MGTSSYYDLLTNHILWHHIYLVIDDTKKKRTTMSSLHNDSDIAIIHQKYYLHVPNIQSTIVTTEDLMYDFMADPCACGWVLKDRRYDYRGLHNYAHN